MNKQNSTVAYWIFIAVLTLMIFSNFNRSDRAVPTLAYSQFLQDVKAGRVEEVHMQDDRIRI